jgi:hypothetical protein
MDFQPRQIIPEPIRMIERRVSTYDKCSGRSKKHQPIIAERNPITE